MRNTLRNIVTFFKAHPKLDWGVLLLGLAIFVTIALLNAPRASIWFDEAFSAYLIQFNFWDIARYTASDVHPPVYYWILKVWSELFGTTDLALRSLSIVFGAGVITTAFFLTRKLFGRLIAAVALLFLTVSPMLIRYSDEARMYTLAALIIFGATYVLVKARETKSRKLWVLYGVLVSLGMWVHYFTALAWIAHWAWHATEVWRKGMGAKAFWKKFLSKEWLLSYGLAIALYLPWLPFMAMQLGIVQGSGFWIGPVSVNTPANYFSNVFYYLEHGQVQGWFALALLVLLILVAILLPRVYRALSNPDKKSFLLISFMAWVPFVTLFLLSLPPVRPSYVERYLIPAIVAFAIFLAVVLVIGTRRWKPIFRALPILLVVAMMIFGITNVFKYGNFNKNTNFHIFTREVVEMVHEKAKPGQPIVTETPWIFYEAAPYATEEHPIYFLDASTDYFFGSLAMLKENDMHKIKDLEAFKKDHPVIWYLGQNEHGSIPAFESTWVEKDSVGAYDEITGKTIYRATEYEVK